MVSTRSSTKAAAIEAKTARKGKKVSIRRKVVHRVIPHLPPRPKKPATGFNILVREHFAQERAKNDGSGSKISAGDIIRGAAKVWTTLSDEKRQEYRAQAGADRIRFQMEIAQWRAQRRALKRPPYAYALFIKELWVREERSGRNWVEMSRFASGQWDLMSRAEKDKYKTISDRLAARYREQIDNLNGGGELNVIWMNESFTDDEEDVEMEVEE